MTKKMSLSGVSPTELLSMARQASAEYRSEGGSLTDAVVKAASAFPVPLTSEHVKRVCEMTYHDVFENQFRGAGGSDRLVSFDPPDAAAAADRIRAEKVASAHYRAREMMQVQMYNGQVATVDKTASAEPEVATRYQPRNFFDESYGGVKEAETAWDNPYREVQEARDGLSEAINQLAAQSGGLEHRAKTASIKLGSLARDACADGATVGSVLHACMTGLEFGQTPVQDKVAEAMVCDLARFLNSRGFSLTKEASYGEVNPDHPLPAMFAQVAGLKQKHAQSVEALEDLKGQLRTLDGEIRAVAH